MTSSSRDGLKVFAILIDGEEGWADDKWNDQKFGFKPFLRELKTDEGWTSELNSKQINKVSECFKQVISSNLHGEGHFSLMNRSDYIREIKQYCTSKLLKDDPYFEPYIESVIVITSVQYKRLLRFYHRYNRNRKIPLNDS